MLAFSNDYYGIIFRATQSVELFCAYYAVKIYKKVGFTVVDENSEEYIMVVNL